MRLSLPCLLAAFLSVGATADASSYDVPAPFTPCVSQCWMLKWLQAGAPPPCAALTVCLEESRSCDAAAATRVRDYVAAGCPAIDNADADSARFVEDRSPATLYSD